MQSPLIPVPYFIYNGSMRFQIQKTIQ